MGRSGEGIECCSSKKTLVNDKSLEQFTKRYTPSQVIDMKKELPYYAVIFTSIRTKKNEKEYGSMATLMEQLAKEQSGYLGMESARDKVGITVSYWKTKEDIAQWKNQIDHQLAQKLGKEKWYEWYKTCICLVEREYEFFK
ncbi:hypothetical protein GCM10009117_17810 [Gangjinia marincola]|uniref:Antibiotic biosynthesis monooxygenase n=1 Tax=Gangjinia marincola TaxID=578463 RepID=A0ABP3XXM2_9FLAO